MVSDVGEKVILFEGVEVVLETLDKSSEPKTGVISRVLEQRVWAHTLTSDALVG